MEIDSPYLAPIERTTVAEEIVKRLTSMILDTGLKPGHKLPSERELMARLNVGRSSLREGIRTLSALGMVKVVGGSGTFVANGDLTALTQPLSWRLLMNEHTAREVIEARRVVEVELAHLAAERATPEDLASIGRCLEAMRGSSTDTEYLQSDLDFHLAVAAAGHNQVLYNVLETLRLVIRAWMLESFRYADTRRHYLNGQAVQDHAEIYDSICNHDAEAARRIVANRLDTARELLYASIRNTEAHGESSR
jgi:GntR family transcriptional repressor for pyruvate dehydrogenase complex